MPFTRTTRSLTGIARNRISQSIAGVRNPIVRNGLGSLINTVLPGLGGVGDFSDNVFGDQVRSRLYAINAEVNYAAQDTGRVGATQSLDYLNKDWRPRLRPKNGGMQQFYANLAQSDPDGSFYDYLMRPIVETGGLVWQYTPEILLSTTVEYHKHQGHGMNYPVTVYQKSVPPDITITADFTASDMYEARYVLAMQTFFKIATKSHAGELAVAKGTAGMAPPILLFEYLGDHGFNRVPVVVSAYSIQLPNNVDYVPVEVMGNQGSTVTYVPVTSSVNVTLTPSYNPLKTRKRYDLDRIANGAAYKDGFI